jgi:hypothetical protein
MLLSPQELFINKLSLIISLILLASLLQKPLSLLEGIVQLSEHIADLASAYKRFRSFSEAQICSVLFSEWRHQFRMMHDERWIDADRFDVFTDEFVEHACVGLWW